jgi:hypothetical protein
VTKAKIEALKLDTKEKLKKLKMRLRLKEPEFMTSILQIA